MGPETGSASPACEAIVSFSRGKLEIAPALASAAGGAGRGEQAFAAKFRVAGPRGPMRVAVSGKPGNAAGRR